MNDRDALRRGARCVPKVTGADAELGNLVLGGPARAEGTGREASHALLHEVDGVRGAEDGNVSGTPPDCGWVWSTAAANNAISAYRDPQDIGRRYLPSNGGCVYVDLDHLEICTPEVLSATDFVAAWHAMLRIARAAQSAANAARPPGERIVVLVNSSDGHGNAYGSHLSFLMHHDAWRDLLVRRLHPGLFVLAAHQVSSIVFAGQGKVGAENGRPPVAYQLSQRADFFDRIVGPQTTFDRPIVNSRDEPLCGHAGTTATGAPLARLHCIFYDSTLCHTSTLLKVGAMQIVLAMLEAGYLDRGPMLDDPVTALTLYSHDPDLAARARLADGRTASAVELQSMLCERARTFVDTGGCDGVVPDAAGIVALWEDTLGKLAARDLDALAPRLDWVLKLTRIDRALASRGLDWSAPQAKHLDHLYSSLDPDEGIYWPLERAGLTEMVVEEARIEQFRRTPPRDTRAWRRAMLLRRVPPGRVRRVDWDRIELEPAEPGGRPVLLDLGDPLGDADTVRPAPPAGVDDAAAQQVPTRHGGGRLLN